MRFHLILPFLLLFSYSNAQQGTTLEEYRYLTKGYAYQKEMGLDASKDGYDFRALHTAQNGIEFIAMYRVGGMAPQAILCIFDKGISPNSFLCLPNNAAAKDIVALYEKDRANTLSYEKRKALDKALSELLFVQMGERSNGNVYAQAPATATYQKEVFTPRGTSSQPLVATAKSAPSYPVQAPKVNTNDPWEGLPITATQTTTPPVSYDYPVVAQKNIEVLSAANLKMDFSLDNRPISYQAPLNTATRKAGKVVIKLCVSSNGDVISSKFTQRGSTSLDATLIKLALDNATNIKFQQNNLPEQCGTITYAFNL